MLWNNATARVTGLVIAGAAVLAAPGGHGVASCWQTVPGPAVPAGDSGNLVGVSMPGPASGWAVGFTLPNRPPGANFHPLLARWDGHRWRAARPPAGTGAGRLDGVTALSASNAWAVGAAMNANHDSAPLIIHWNGHRWARVHAAPVPGFADTELLGVAATSSSNAWAVGEAENTAMRLRTVTEHWNGRTWTLVPSPSAGTRSALSGVAAIHGQAWAVGGSFAPTSRPLVLHWTGHTWQRAATPRASDVQLDGVAVVFPNQVWAVGAIPRDGLRRPYALRWNGGRAWHSVPVPPGPARDGRELVSVTGLGGGRLAAVGNNLGPATTGALHAAWNGRHWSITAGPLNGTSLAAVTAGGRTLWAVGAKDQSASRFVPLVQTCHR